MRFEEAYRLARRTIDASGSGVFYTERGSHYFHTPAAGGKVDKNNPTQVGRALKQLGIKHIAAWLRPLATLSPKREAVRNALSEHTKDGSHWNWPRLV